jgi:CBS domain-containing protein
MVRVGEVMDRNATTIPATMRVMELSDRIARHDPQVTRHEGLVIVNENQQLAGIITRGDVLRALEQGGNNGTTVLDAGSPDVVVTFPDEVLHEATLKMLRNNIGRLPVVRRQDPRSVVGYLGRSSLMEAHLRQLEDEHVRDRRFPRRRPVQSDIPA